MDPTEVNEPQVAPTEETKPATEEPKEEPKPAEEPKEEAKPATAEEPKSAEAEEPNKTAEEDPKHAAVDEPIEEAKPAEAPQEEQPPPEPEKPKTPEPTEKELALMARLEELQRQIKERNEQIAAKEKDVEALPTLQDIADQRAETDREIQDLEEQIDMKTRTIGVLTPIRERGYMLAARIHRLENYGVRSSMWVEDVFVGEIDRSIHNHRREAELKVAAHIKRLLGSREKQQHSILALKDRIRQNASSLTKGHFSVPQKETRGFERVPTKEAKESFGRASVERFETPEDKETVQMRDHNETSAAELCRLREKVNSLSKTKTELSLTLKQLKSQIQRENNGVKQDATRAEGDIQRSLRAMQRLESNNSTTASTITFLMKQLQLIHMGTRNESTHKRLN